VTPLDAGLTQWRNLGWQEANAWPPGSSDVDPSSKMGPLRIPLLSKQFYYL